MAISVTADAITATLSWKSVVLTHYPPAARNPDLDLELNYNSIEPNDVEITILGTWSAIAGVVDGNILPFTITIVGQPLFSELIDASTIPITLTLHGSFFSDPARLNWVKWSNIGSLDFTIWKDNVAGERPMDWKGWVYEIKKLEKRVVVYGQGGVSILTPVGTAWGLETVSRVGVKSKGAICGSDYTQFYIDILGRLCKVEKGIEILGYEEYLDSMTAFTKMTYDEMNQLIYICDGTSGYIYSIKDESFGEGPANITGLVRKGSSVYMLSLGAITMPAFNICTDIFDLGNRRNKTIQSLDIGANLTNDLYAAVDYRLDKKVAFATTPWVPVNPNGLAITPCFGVEFRFRVKTLVYEDFKLDYIRVNGILHNYSFIDSFAWKG